MEDTKKARHSACSEKLQSQIQQGTQMVSQTKCLDTIQPPIEPFYRKGSNPKRRY